MVNLALAILGIFGSLGTVLVIHSHQVIRLANHHIKLIISILDDFLLARGLPIGGSPWLAVIDEATD